jgi:LuxR family quorum-sensing system transcriptional regulator CciR
MSRSYRGAFAIIGEYCTKQGFGPVRRLADRFYQAASSCTSLKALRSLIVDAAAELRFDYFALLHHVSLRRPQRSVVRIDNYPAQWVSELVDGGLLRHDPVHFASRKANAAFLWSELGSLVELRREHLAIFERSRQFGLGDGLTVPVNVPGEPGGSCSFAVRRGRDLPRERLLCAELVGSHAFRAARRLARLPASGARPHLSRREVQCVRLVAAGKTDWEIAVILGIAVETARQYVKRARSAYGAVSRAQLVALGLRDDWLSFDEALDPRA